MMSGRTEQIDRSSGVVVGAVQEMEDGRFTQW